MSLCLGASTEQCQTSLRSERLSRTNQQEDHVAHGSDIPAQRWSMSRDAGGG